MDLIEKTLSNLIPSQFPSFYEEEGEIFIEFVKLYYQWLEQPGNALYNSRRIFEYRDIDETTDQYLIFFKETYLKNIQLDTSQNIRQLIKHSLDLYRSKGSERALRLLFQAVFGVTPSVYYPGDDIFKLSDGQWVIPTYLEITPSDSNALLVNKQIQGTISGATAFVDAAVRQIGNKISDILYISSKNGNFITGEQLTLSFEYSSTDNRPVVVGSLNDIEISTQGIGSGFSIGDIIDNITSDKGYGATARVDEISKTVGLVNFILNDGGYGYSNNTIVLISENILTLQTNTAPAVFETISQDLAVFPYVNANDSFNKEDTVSSYYANGMVRGTARVLSVDSSNSTAGNLSLEILTGNLNSNAIYNDSNAVAANLNVLIGYVDQTATANIMAIEVIDSNTVKVGVFSESNQFFINVHFKTSNSNSNGILSIISSGFGANLNISNDLLYTEDVSINSDKLSDYIDIELGATAYDFPLHPSANLSSNISYCLSYNTITFGKIARLASVSQGSGYNDKPFITIFDPYSLPLQRQNYILTFANATSSFVNGEMITQQSSNARGLIIDIDQINSKVTLQNLRVSPDIDFLISTDANSAIVGDQSGTIANVLSASFDPNSKFEGDNVDLDIELNSADGSITGLQIINSGFNYANGEVVTIALGNNIIGTGHAVLNNQGMGTGYYRKKGGFLSDNKKIFDGYYYQNFSYDIISSVPLEKYSKLLKDVIHQAGRIFFGTFCHQRKINTNSTVKSIVSISS